MANHVVLTASGDLKKQGSTGKLYGFNVIVALSAAAVNLRDGGDAGTIRAVIPASSAIGYTINFDDGIVFNDGIYVDFDGTGTVGFNFA